MQEEIWKDIKGYEGLYEISDKGRVRSLGRSVLKKNGATQYVPERILKHSGDYVTLSAIGVQRVRTVHLLVKEAFNGDSTT